MKKIINRRMYNTDTAEELGSYWNGFSVSDFSYCKEKLYRKKTGEFFLCGEGGARSKYCRTVGDLWCDGEDIIPLTEDEAMTWVERYMDADDFTAIFGEVEE